MSNPNRFEAAVAAYTTWVVRHPWLVLLAVAVFTAVAAAGAQRLVFSTDYRVYFGPDNPQLLAFNEVQNIYAKNDNVLFVVEPRNGDAFDPEVLAAVEFLTEESWTLPFALRVDSVTNYQHTEAVDDDLLVAKLVEDAAALDAAQVERIRAIATQEPLLVNRLVSPSGHVTAVNVTFQFPEADEAELPTAVTAARALRDRVLAEYPAVRAIPMTGSNMMSNAFTEAALSDIKTLIPAMYLMIVAVLWLLLRSLVATLLTVLVVLVSATAAMGAAGWIGIGLTPPSVSAPHIITTLAVADCVHILLSLFGWMRHEKLSRHEAIVQALRVNFTPILLTSVTTALGFLSINFTDSPPLQDLGNITAIGVMLAWLYAVTLLPALLALLPLRAPAARGDAMGQAMTRLGDLVLRRRRAVFWTTLALALGLVALVPLNEANDRFTHYFDESIAFRADTDFTVDNLTGLYGMEFSLRSAGGANGIADPEYLRQVEDFADWWRTHPKVIHVSPITDIFKRLNRNMHGDDPAWYRLPEARDLAAQYLLLYEMSLPFGLDLNNSINVDKSATRFTVAFENLSSRETREIAQSATDWLRENAPQMETLGVSPAVMFAYIAKRNIQAMFLVMPLSLIAISLLLIPALKSVRLGLLSLLPNLLPLGVAFGIWALVSGEINFTMAVVLGMVIGIVVDDTIHFLSKYLRARRELALPPEEAVRYTFRTVGGALTVTSLVLTAGFLILAQSAFLPNAGMAQLTCIAIVAALVADLLLLPPLLLALERRASFARAEAPEKLEAFEELIDEPSPT